MSQDHPGITLSRREAARLKRLARQAARETREKPAEIAASNVRRSPGVRKSPRVCRSRSARTRARNARIRKLLLRLGIVAAAAVVLLLVHPPFLVPLDGRVTSRFFLRTQPESIFLFDVEHHRGIDIAAPVGTPVRAARSGRIVAVTQGPTYGLVVDIRHPIGLVTRYAHLSRQDVHEGQWIWRRNTLGAVGMTGRATGPHLHFEIRMGGTSLPPGFLLVWHNLRRSVFSRS